MRTASTRQLKQNPAEVIRMVLADGQGVEVTAHGHPTGVLLVPARQTKQTWVAGSVLNAMDKMGRAEAEAWEEDMAAAPEVDLSDPWAGDK
jgi:prevent-host-death family protein